MLNKIVHIVGPTGVGKTELAFKLAARFNGELVNADSVQVYKGLDIISGKDIPSDSPFTKLPEFSSKDFNVGFYNVDNIPIYLLDIVEPTFSFNVSHFQKLGKEVIGFISGNNKLPIIVGGTGLYVKSLVDGIETSRVNPDINVRKELENKEITLLQNMLKKINEQKYLSMNESDKNNKRRLIRAIEIAKNPISLTTYKLLPEFTHLQIALFAPREFLKEKIDKRVNKRLEEGALREATKLFKKYDHLAQQVKDANGYKQLFGYLKKELSLEEAIYRWKVSEYRHAKNQMTWFKKYGNVIWFDITQEGYEKEIEEKIATFLLKSHSE